jgi:small subunit ribosomal protein S7
MPRRKSPPKREILPDPKYKDKLVARFINGVLRKGKKSLAESILYGAFDIINKRSNKEPLYNIIKKFRERGKEEPNEIIIFKEAIEKVKPKLEVKSRRVGGATYQVPVEVPPDRQTSLAIRWLIQYAKLRKGKTMKERLAAEICEAALGKGNSIKKRDDTHKMAEANKAFAHYRW